MLQKTLFLLLNTCLCLIWGQQTRAQNEKTQWCQQYIGQSLVIEYEALASDTTIKHGSYRESWLIKSYTANELPSFMHKLIKQSLTKRLKTEGAYTHNKRTGKWTYYSNQSNIDSTGFFKDDLHEGQWASYWINGKLRQVVSYTKDQPNGRWQFYTYNGALSYEGDYLNGKPTNQWQFYAEDGTIDTLLNKELYAKPQDNEHAEMVDGLLDKTTNKDSIYQIIVMPPEGLPNFFGGESALFRYLSENIKYPEIARENGIEGTVYIEFIINRQGFVDKAIVKRGVDTACDEEAYRVINQMPRWIPGRVDGKPVQVIYTLPIKFKLQ